MSEADYMHFAQMSQLGAEFGGPDPEFEVIVGKRQERVFCGSRAECWNYRRARGGFVRPYSGDDDEMMVP
jgi:hypothetical protein